MTLPRGLGVFWRDRAVLAPDGAPWGHVLINARRADRLDLAAQARASGAQVWAYTTPEGWRPPSWRSELELVERAADEMRADGIVANPESGWPELGERARVAGLTELGAALAAAANSRGVAVCSFPLFPNLRELAAAAGSSVSGIVQIYGRTVLDAGTFSRWWSRWVGAWGEDRTGLAVAGWPPRAEMEQPVGFARYLAALPRPASRSVSVWTAAGSAPAPWRLTALASWYGTGPGPAAPPSSPAAPPSSPGVPPSSPSSPPRSSAPSAGAGWGWLLLLLGAAFALRRRGS